MTSQVVPDNPRQELARELDSLRGRHCVTLRELGKRAASNRTTLSDATNPKKRLVTQDVMLRFVQGCTQGCARRYREEQERKFLALWIKADRWENQ